jgi:adenylate kinase family enzyme
MLINFLGAPSSGKTTIAANVFARLKAMGVSAEFIAERAREVIAKYKMQGKPLDLNDEMQNEIFLAQYDAEMAFATGTENPIICDSSALLTLAYMSDGYAERHVKVIEHIVESITPKMDIVFYCPLVKRENLRDSNRIHNFAQSEEVDKKIRLLIKERLTGKKVVVLSGTIEDMTYQVICEIMSKKNHLTQKTKWVQ